MDGKNRISLDSFTVLIISALSLILMSCIFDSEPTLPGFPAIIDATIPFSAIGSPSICKCMVDYDLALVAAGSNLVAIDIINGVNKSVIDLGCGIDDIADSDADGFGYILADSLLYPLRLPGCTLEDPIEIGIGCNFVSVSSMADTAWVSMLNDSIGMVNLVTGEVSVVQNYSSGNCQGIAAADNGALYIAEKSTGCITGYNTANWSELGRIPVPGDVLDLFPGPSGYICAIVDNSNELWYIKTDTSVLYKMITFPVIPTAGASTPGGGYAYATCPGVGMLIVAESGQLELKTQDFGLPSSIDITSDGERAVICSPDNEAVYILVR